MKKLLAGLLIFILAIAPVSVFADETAQVVQDTQASEAVQTEEVSQSAPYGYIPLRNAAEVTNAEIGWNDGVVTISAKGFVYEFKHGNDVGKINGEDFKFRGIPLLYDDIMYVMYDDVKFLFEDADEVYPEAKKSAVVTAYYLMREYKVPSISMAVVDVEKEYNWIQTFGYKNIERKEVATSKTTYSLASISKVFTAIAVMQLVEAGKLNLDEKVVTYLPEFKINKNPVYGGDYREITLRMLLAHVSGIPGDNFDSFYSVENYNKDFMNHFIEDLAAQYMDNVQGQRWNYANNGYTLLGIIVSRTAGYADDFADFVSYTNENIFNRMELSLSSFKVNSPILIELASSYTNSDLPETANLLANPLPAAGLYSSGEDMARVMKFLLNNGEYDGIKLLEKNSIETMANPSGYDQKLNPQLQMGLGLYTTKIGLLNMTGHGGDIANFHSDMQFSFDNGAGVFVTGNSTTSVYVSQSVSALTLSALVSEKTGVANDLAAKESAAAVTKEITPDVNTLTQYAGLYTGIGDVSITEDLKLSIPMLEATYSAKENGSFYNEESGTLWFENVGGIEVVYYGENKDLVIGEKITVTPMADDFKRYAGTYVPVNTTPGDVEIITSVTISLDENGIASLGFTVNDGQAGSGMLISRIEGDLYYIPGTSRNYGKVFKLYTSIGLSYIDIFGMTLMKQ